MDVRKPAVAGLFYEADPHRLAQHIAALLGAVHAADRQRPKALIVPHAGYIYSGPTAAEAYHCLLPLRDTIERVVLLGPAHRVYLQGMAVPSVDAFATSILQTVELVRELKSGHTVERLIRFDPFLPSVRGFGVIALGAFGTFGALHRPSHWDAGGS